MGSSQSRNANVHVVIVGAGSAGIHTARELEKHVRVTLINPSSSFMCAMAAPRAFVESGFEKKIFWDLNKLMKHGGVFMQGTAETISPDSVTVRKADGSVETISATYVVVATGAAYSAPIFSEADPAKIQEEFAGAQKAFAAAKSVVVIGGGAVGCEIAAEVKTDFPGCEVTMVHSGAEILNEGVSHLPEKGAAKYRAAVAAKLANVIGVKVLTGTRATRPEQLQEGSALLVAPTTLQLSNGTTLDADVVIWAAGAGKPASSSLKMHFGDQLDASGRIRVTDTLQVEGCPSVFAIGDVKAQVRKAADPMMAYHASLQAKHVAKSIIGLVAGKPAALYKAGPPAQFLALGRNHGQGVMGSMVVSGTLPTTAAYAQKQPSVVRKPHPIAFAPLCPFPQVGDFMVTRAKSRNMFVNQIDPLFK